MAAATAARASHPTRQEPVAAMTTRDQEREHRHPGAGARRDQPDGQPAAPEEPVRDGDVGGARHGREGDRAAGGVEHVELPELAHPGEEQQADGEDGGPARDHPASAPSGPTAPPGERTAQPRGDAADGDRERELRARPSELGVQLGDEDSQDRVEEDDRRECRRRAGPDDDPAVEEPARGARRLRGSAQPTLRSRPGVAAAAPNCEGRRRRGGCRSRLPGAMRLRRGAAPQRRGAAPPEAGEAGVRPPGSISHRRGRGRRSEGSPRR